MHYADLCETMARSVAIGVAPHSLRAVTPEELDAAIGIAGDGRPIHIHVAEQEKEVADCLAWSGARPVAWLLDHAPVDHRWCLVHATHIDAAERQRLAASGAVAGLCQTTEANLGDGSFPLREYLADGGRFGIGSDSNVCTSPVEELRWLEYIRRLETRTRNVTETRPGASVALNLYQRALAGGAQALGRNAGAIAPGRIADLVVLDTEHPTLVGRAGEAMLDAWLFSGNNTPVRDVMVAGAWVVRDGGIARRRRSPPGSPARCDGWPARFDVTAPPSPPCTPPATAADDTAVTASAARPTDRTTIAASHRSRRPAAAARPGRSRAGRPGSGSGCACAPSGRTTAASAAARTGRPAPRRRAAA